MECLWDFLPNFLQGFTKSLQPDGLVWSLSQPFVHFVPHVLDWRQIGGHRGSSHHQHILMSEKIHDETRNMWSSIVPLKGHFPSLTTDEGQHVRFNNLLQLAVCIQLAINNDQGCFAMGWDATPHHHTPTAKRTSLSNACILVALAHPEVHHYPTIWIEIHLRTVQLPILSDATSDGYVTTLGVQHDGMAAEACARRVDGGECGVNSNGCAQSWGVYGATLKCLVQWH